MRAAMTSGITSFGSWRRSSTSNDAALMLLLCETVCKSSVHDLQTFSYLLLTDGNGRSKAESAAHTGKLNDVTTKSSLKASRRDL